MTNIQHIPGTISQADADRQTEVVKKIMAEQKLDYGPAYDVYIKRQQASPSYRDHGLAASHRPLFG